LSMVRIGNTLAEPSSLHSVHNLKNGIPISQFKSKH
jgi:hypothetical protein